MRTRWVGLPALAAICLLCGGFTTAQDKASPVRDTEKQGKSQQKQGQQEGRSEAFYGLEDFIKDHDQNGDGAIQRDELTPRLREDFASLDRNEDGKLDKDELARHGRRMMERDRQGHTVYIWIWRARQDRLTRQDLQDAYSLLRQVDGDNDGKISDDELQSGREKARKHWIDAQLKHLDEDGDAQLSKKEVRGYLRRGFERIDKNSDGKITREELTEAMQERARERDAQATPAEGKKDGGRPREGTPPRKDQP